MASQPSFRQQLFGDAFRALMGDIGDTLAAKNRDLFTQNLAVFRRDVNNQPKSAAPAPVVVEYMNSDYAYS